MKKIALLTLIAMFLATPLFALTPSEKYRIGSELEREISELSFVFHGEDNVIDFDVPMINGEIDAEFKGIPVGDYNVEVLAYHRQNPNMIIFYDNISITVVADQVIDLKVNLKIFDIGHWVTIVLDNIEGEFLPGKDYVIQMTNQDGTEAKTTARFNDEGQIVFNAWDTFDNQTESVKIVDENGITYTSSLPGYDYTELIISGTPTCQISYTPPPSGDMEVEIGFDYEKLIFDDGINAEISEPGKEDVYEVILNDQVEYQIIVSRSGDLSEEELPDPILEIYDGMELLEIHDDCYDDPYPRAVFIPSVHEEGKWKYTLVIRGSESEMTGKYHIKVVKVGQLEVIPAIDQPGIYDNGIAYFTVYNPTDFPQPLKEIDFEAHFSNFHVAARVDDFRLFYGDFTPLARLKKYSDLDWTRSRAIFTFDINDANIVLQPGESIDFIIEADTSNVIVTRPSRDILLKIKVTRNACISTETKINVLRWTPQDYSNSISWGGRH